MTMDYKKRCSDCGILTYDWETVGGVNRCWECGRKAREADICHHTKGTVAQFITAAGDVDYTVSCHCGAAWPYGTQPAKMTLFDVLGKAWKR
jgi:hypothetical protein